MRRWFRALTCTTLLVILIGLIALRLAHKEFEFLCSLDNDKLRFLVNPEEIFGGTNLSATRRPLAAMHLGPHAADVTIFKIAGSMQRTLIYRRSAGFRVGSNYYGIKSFGVSMTGKYVQVPTWFLEVACASYPAWLILSWSLTCLARTRSAVKVCRKCGYNLAGLTEPKCPECGTQF
jgi:hypothetical protein